MTSSNCCFYGSDPVEIDDLSPGGPLWYESPETPFDDLKSVQYGEIKKEPEAFNVDPWHDTSSSSGDYNNALVPTPTPSHSRSQRMMPYARSSSSSSPSMKSGPASSRGRPSKATSNSKMATYARNYREVKKSQMAQCTQQNEELKAENFRLRMDNHELQASLTRLEQELGHIREAFGRTSTIVSAISCLKSAPDAKPSPQSELFNGFCLHLMDGKFSFEVCQQCSNSARSKLNPETTTAPTFNSDFDSISKFV